MLVLLFLKAEQYMLPCLNKTFLGFECPGCGIQRAALLVFKGQFAEAFYMYPAIYTLFFFFGIILYNFFFPFKKAFKIIFFLGVLNAIIILGNYFLKLTF